MPCQSWLTQLRDALTSLYATDDDARRIAADAGLDTTSITFSGKVTNTWQAILEEAGKQEGQVEAIIEVATNKYPKAASLLGAAVAYYQQVSMPRLFASAPTSALSPVVSAVEQQRADTSARHPPSWRLLVAAGVLLSVVSCVAGWALSTMAPALSPTLTSTPAHRVIAGTEQLTGWTPDLGNSKGDRSANHVSLAPGRTGNAIGIWYDLGADGYVIASKGIDATLLSGTRGISFSYQGSGAANTIEFKLMLQYPGEGDTCYGILFPRATDSNGDWVEAEVLYSDLRCWWPEESCQKHGNEPDLARIVRLDFAVSNKSSDDVGSGTVAFDDVWGILP